MPPVDSQTLYVIILTITNTLAIGGAAGLLLFPGRFEPGRKDTAAASALNLDPAENAPSGNSGSRPISWGATSITMLGSRSQR